MGCGAGHGVGRNRLRPPCSVVGKEKAELNFHHAPAGTWMAVIAPAVESTFVTAAAYTNELKRIFEFALRLLCSECSFNVAAFWQSMSPASLLPRLQETKTQFSSSNPCELAQQKLDRVSLN